VLPKIKHHIVRRFYDSHPYLPLDPDSDQLVIVRPIHTDWAHIAIVGIGAFFGTLARYEIGLWLPNGKSGWPTATLLINVAGAFLLGLLLQALLHYGKDVGGRRILRLTLGTGFMGAFNTYSSLATSVVLFGRDEKLTLAIMYAAVSVVLGIMAAAFGIWTATNHHKRKHGGRA
jgi:CrcB protein